MRFVTTDSEGREVVDLGGGSTVGGDLTIDGGLNVGTTGAGPGDIKGSGELIMSGTGDSSFAGKVGIGTTSPGTLLHLSGTPTTQGSLDYHIRVHDSTSWAEGVGGGIAFSGMVNSSNDRVGGGIDLIKENAVAGDNSFALRFYTRSHAAGNVTEAMRISSVGNVGIGIALPLAKTHIDQSSSTGAIPVLALDQADVSEGFTNFLGASAASAVGPISTWTAGNTIQGFVRVEINDTQYWMPYYDAPTS